ncbi:hypothetical protein HII36_34445 [Nonomuraea sp. NN258]|uniref:hypothetical protein n=1 Tax=Nonomuraea antri TaxID=2730852 RepID=UPI001569E5DC|nr:hypothetical protein [Nonomuraea antri]NRQ36902.1 hypothetical protein [Nonomuraea antri]
MFRVVAALAVLALAAIVVPKIKEFPGSAHLHLVGVIGLWAVAAGAAVRCLVPLLEPGSLTRRRWLLRAAGSLAGAAGFAMFAVASFGLPWLEDSSAWPAWTGLGLAALVVAYLVGSTIEEKRDERIRLR